MAFQQVTKFREHSIYMRAYRPSSSCANKGFFLFIYYFHHELGALKLDGVCVTIFVHVRSSRLGGRNLLDLNVIRQGMATALSTTSCIKLDQVSRYQHAKLHASWLKG
jgi:hypothetical protein